MKLVTETVTDSEISDISKYYEHANTVPSYLEDLLAV